VGLSVLALLALGLQACGGDDEPVAKKRGGGDMEDGGNAAPRPVIPGKPAPPKPVVVDTGVKPLSPAEYARKRAAWQAFERGQEVVDGGGVAGTATPAGGSAANLSPRMKAWYSDYNVVATSVKLALPRYEQAVQSGDAAAIAAACAELQSAASRVFSDPAALASPDLGVNRALSTAYRAYQMAADACTGGRVAERDTDMAAARQALAAATKTLRPYQLEP
jgi:hypothetical protein